MYMSCMNDDVVMIGVKWKSEGVRPTWKCQDIYASSKDGIQWLRHLLDTGVFRTHWLPQGLRSLRVSSTVPLYVMYI